MGLPARGESGLCSVGRSPDKTDAVDQYENQTAIKPRASRDRVLVPERLASSGGPPASCRQRFQCDGPSHSGWHRDGLATL